MQSSQHINGFSQDRGLQGQDWRADEVRFGTAEPVLRARRLSAGALALDLFQGAVRNLTWAGIEVIRGIDCPVRDQNWATCSGAITEEDFTASSHGFECVQRRVLAGGALSYRLVLKGSAGGAFRASLELQAQQDFLTNRAGFVILHPLEGLVGSAFTLWHSDGTQVVGHFPMRISPDQVAFDIAGLRYAVHGIEAQIRFNGEVFEMEDQRNWSDASFKTYCRPLAQPVPYLLRAGETLRQEIEIHLSGLPRRRAGVSLGSDRPTLELSPSLERVPTVALALELPSLPADQEISHARRLKPRILQLRLDPDSAEAVIAGARELVGDEPPQIELEIVVPRDRGIEPALADIARRCQAATLPITRVTALPQAYLSNYQPEGPWPEGPTPWHACLAARHHFPDARVGGGVFTHFVEFNRCRPNLSLCDFITHGSTAILHAADDQSVIDTLGGLSHLYASARALANDHEYRLGLVSIGMRLNPHGAEVAPNPTQSRVPMAGVDPRQRGLFGAAWAVGAVAATAGHGVTSLALGAPVGPFGLIYRRAAWPQPLYDDRSDAAVYPLYHVVRALLALAAGARYSILSLPPGVVGVAGRREGLDRLILANLSAATARVELPRRATVRRLDQVSFESATIDPDWLCTAPSEDSSQVTLDSLDVAFVEWREPPA